MKKILVFALMLPLLFACGTKVKRMDVDTAKDLSGKWNDTDSRMVAESMIQECLGSAWYTRACRVSSRLAISSCICQLRTGRSCCSMYT